MILCEMNGPVMDILITVDDLRLALSIASRLKREGHKTVNISHTRHGVAAAVRHRPDVAILEVRGAALRVLSELRNSAATAQVPVVVLTNASETTLESLEQLAPARIFPSPPPMDQLVAAIAELQSGAQKQCDKDQAEPATAEHAR